MLSTHTAETSKSHKSQRINIHLRLILGQTLKYYNTQTSSNVDLLGDVS